MRGIGRAYIEHFGWEYNEVSVSKTFKRQGNSRDMRIIKRKGQSKEDWEEPEGLFVWPLSLGPISNQLGFIDMRK